MLALEPWRLLAIQCGSLLTAGTGAMFTTTLMVFFGARGVGEEEEGLKCGARKHQKKTKIKKKN